MKIHAGILILLPLWFIMSYSGVCDTLSNDRIVNITLLEDKLEQAPINEKPALYNQLANEYLEVSPEKSRQYASNALNLAKISDNRKEEARAYFLIGRANRRLMKYDRAQDNLIKALELQKTSGSRESISEVHFELGLLFQDISDFPASRKHIESSLEIEREKGDMAGVSSRIKELGDVYYSEGNFKASLDHYFEALDIKKQLNRTGDVAELYNDIGILYFDFGNYEDALENYLRSLELMESLNNRQGQAYTLNNIGIVYYEWGNKEKALEYYQKSLLIEEELGNEEGLSGSYNNIGIIYSDWGQNELAIEYYQKSLEISRKYGKKRGIAQTMNNIGESYFELGKTDKALEYLVKSLGKEKELNNLVGMAASYHTIGNIYYQQQNYTKAAAYLDSSHSIADSLRLSAILLDNYILFSDLYSSAGNFRRAFDYLGKYTVLKDSIYNKNFLEQMSRLQLKYEIDQKEKEKELLMHDYEAKEEVIHRQRIYVGVIFLLMLVFLAIILYDKRLKRRSHHRLKDKNIEINQQKEKLTETIRKLERSEEKYKRLIKNSPTGILYMDASGKILEVNEKLLEILGSPSEEATKQINCLTFPPLKEAGMVDDILKCIETSRLVYNEAPYISKWEKKIEVRYFLTPIRDEKGDVSHVILNVEDITARKTAEQALMKSESRYKNLVDNSLQALFVIQDHSIVFANARLCELTNYTEEELSQIRGEWFKTLVHPEDWSKAASLSADLRGRKRAEVRFVQKDGTVRWIEMLASGLDYYEEKSTLIVAVDISGHKHAQAILKESEKKLKDANITKDKFFSIIAHDLKNPFNTILGFSNLLMHSYDSVDDDQRKRIIANIYEASETTFKLLQNLLDWARSQAGKIEFTPQKVDISVIIGDTMAVFATSAMNKNIEMISSVPVNTWVYGDTNMLRTIVRNLVSNAIKFTERGGKVEITGNKTDNMMHITVSDTGIGIDKEKISELFEIGHKHGTTGTGHERGTGLGLILCREFVNKNGGKIFVESRKGTGTSFTFTIPVPD